MHSEEYSFGDNGAANNPRRSLVSLLCRNAATRFHLIHGLRIGKGTLIPLSTSFIEPAKINFGRHVVLERNSTFDGRTSIETGLEIGDYCRLKENVWCAAYDGFIKIGHHVLIGRNSVIHGHGGVTIGDWTMMGPGVLILSSEHGHHLTVERIPFQLQPQEFSPVTIGDNVWIGAGVTVLPGVTIGQDVVIGAGAVVVKDLASGYVYAGVPALKVGEIPRRL